MNYVITQTRSLLDRTNYMYT